MIIRLAEISIIQKLSKKNTEFPISSHSLFDSKDCYFKYIRFSFNISTENYRLRPSFHFSNFTDICQNLRKENGQTICRTKHFIIELEDAIRYNEIEIIGNSKYFQYEENPELNSFKDELIDVHNEHEQGLTTEKELISKVISMNSNYCLGQEKWKSIVKPNYFIGGIAGNT